MPAVLKSRRGLLGAGIVVAAVAVTTATVSTVGADESAAPAPSAQDCTLEELPTPDGTMQSIATAVDPAGDIVLANVYPEDYQDHYERQVVVWQDDEVLEIDVPGAEQSMSSVNSSGTAVGKSGVREEGRAWVYSDGEVSELTGVDSGAARDVNEDGVIVGLRTDDPDGATLPVLWPSPSEDAVDLELPEAAESAFASGIDDDGTVVGHYVSAEDGVWHPYLWDAEGEGRDLVRPGDADGNIRASEISDGWILGSAPGYGTLRWHLPTDDEPEVLPDMLFFDLNANGWLAGNDATAAIVMTDENEFTRLPGVSGAPFHGDFAHGLSDDGSVAVGQSKHQNSNDSIAVKWTCE